MFLEILAAIVLGIAAGIITGLIPGIHINLISLGLLSISPWLLEYTTLVPLTVFIISMSITHSFLDFIPSVFLGAPESETALSILPGHKMLMDGKAFEAVKLTVIGSFFALVVSIALVPVLLVVVPYVYSILEDYIAYILIAVMCFMILKDKTKLQNLIVFLISGTMGVIVLNSPNISNPLFPMLSGLFGVSMLSVSYFQNVSIPKQSTKETLTVDKKEYYQAIGAGTLAGTLTSFFPGLGPAQGAVIASQLTRKISEYGFMVIVGGINTVNFVLSLMTLFTIEKARNGAVVVISELMEVNMRTLLIFIFASLVVGGVAVFLALKITKVFSKVIVKVNYKLLVILVVILITSLAFYFSGFIALLILFTATMIGIIPGEWGVSRNHAMGCLILPVILYLL